jgi:hypothetical protein
VQEAAGLTKPDPSVKRRRVDVGNATPELLVPQNHPSVSGTQGEVEDVAASGHHPPVAARPQFLIVGTGDDPIVDRSIPWATLVNYVAEIPPWCMPQRRMMPKVMPRPALQRNPSDVCTCQAPPSDDDAEEVARRRPVRRIATVCIPCNSLREMMFMTSPTGTVRTWSATPSNADGRATGNVPHGPSASGPSRHFSPDGVHRFSSGSTIFRQSSRSRHQRKQTLSSSASGAHTEARRLLVHALD